MADGALVGTSGISVNASGVVVAAAGTACCCDGTLYRRARYCSGVLSPYVMTNADAQVFVSDVASDAFYFDASPTNGCYYFLWDDGTLSAAEVASLGLLIETAAAATDILTCEDCPCPSYVCDVDLLPDTLTMSGFDTLTLDWGTTTPDPTYIDTPNSTSVEMDITANACVGDQAWYLGANNVVVDGYRTFSPPTIVATVSGTGFPVFIILLTFKLSTVASTGQFIFAKYRCQYNLPGDYYTNIYGFDPVPPELGPVTGFLTVS